MKGERLYRTKDIVSIFIVVSSLFFSSYMIFALLHENLGIGQTFISFTLLIPVFLIFFLTIGLLRHFTGFAARSWIFYTFQFLIAIIASFFIVFIFTSQVVIHSKEKMFTMIKNELTPTITYIEKHQEHYGKVPKSISTTDIKTTSINNIYYYTTVDNFILGAHIPSIDIDGGQIFYDSRDKHWYQFHNDMYQYYQDKKGKPKSIEKYISFSEQTGITITSLKKINGKFIETKKKLPNTKELK